MSSLPSSSAAAAGLTAAGVGLTAAGVGLTAAGVGVAAAGVGLSASLSLCLSTTTTAPEGLSTAAFVVGFSPCEDALPGAVGGGRGGLGRTGGKSGASGMPLAAASVYAHACHRHARDRSMQDRAMRACSPARRAPGVPLFITSRCCGVARSTSLGSWIASSTNFSMLEWRPSMKTSAKKPSRITPRTPSATPLAAARRRGGAVSRGAMAPLLCTLATAVLAPCLVARAWASRVATCTCKHPYSLYHACQFAKRVGLG